MAFGNFSSVANLLSSKYQAGFKKNPELPKKVVMLLSVSDVSATVVTTSRTTLALSSLVFFFILN